LFFLLFFGLTDFSSSLDVSDEDEEDELDVSTFFFDRLLFFVFFSFFFGGGVGLGEMEMTEGLRLLLGSGFLGSRDRLLGVGDLDLEYRLCDLAGDLTGDLIGDLWARPLDQFELALRPGL
jgi:hypothetical protein